MSPVPLMPRTLTPFYDHWVKGRVDPRRVRCGREALDIMEDERRAPDPVVPTRGPGGYWGGRWRSCLEQLHPQARSLGAGLALFTDRLVFDLTVARGRFDALVGDRRLCRVAVRVKRPPAAARQALLTACAGQIPSSSAVLDGALPHPALELVAAHVLPSAAEVDARCPCGRAGCAHTAAALHGLAARLDYDPAALFRLRDLSPADLYDAGAAASLRRSVGPAKARRVLAAFRLAGAMIGV